MSMARQEHRRVERRARSFWRQELRKWQEAAAKRPEHLTPIPAHRLPPSFGAVQLQAWESRRWLVQLYEAPPFNGSPCVRLVACHYPVVREGDFAAGFLWPDPISWEELQGIKRECGFGDRYAIEVYPSDEYVVNIGNSRHLWVPAEPLPIGWALRRAANGGNATIGATA